MVNLPPMVNAPPSSTAADPSASAHVQGRDGEKIANHFIFVWYGARLPAFASIAIRSALKSNPGSTATLLHDATFKPDTEVWSLEATGLVCENINIEKLLGQAQALAPELDVDALHAVYRQLTAPAARSNLVRILALYCRGGVYLDTDTLTIRDLAPLRDSGAFCGQERVLWPAGRRKTSLKAITLGEVRRLCAAIPYAYRANQRLFSHYSLAENNAVMGARRGHPFMLHLLQGVLGVPQQRITKRF
ncbi:MAG TPA: glycosyltransferase, partial [Polyangiaceae bacterium]|nr:glycosyltransferase [Polyangiaceae bacterium]